MSIHSQMMQVFWITCDQCRVETLTDEVYLDDELAVEYAVEAGWSTNGLEFHCPECPPVKAGEAW